MFIDPDAKVPAGTVAVVSGDLARYSVFCGDLVRLRVPDGTVGTWSAGISVASNLNRAVLQFRGDWFWILGDDHRWAPDLLIQLLARMYAQDLDVVIPLCAYRKPPFGPVLAERLSEPPFAVAGVTLPKRLTAASLATLLEENPEGLARALNARLFPDGRYRPMQWDELPPERGLWQLDTDVVAGNAGMLIRRRALERIGDPWFEVGRVSVDQLGEDVWFVEKCHHLGIPVHLATDLRLGHVTPMTVWPTETGAERHVTLELDPDGSVLMPIYPRRSQEGVVADPDLEWATP